MLLSVKTLNFFIKLDSDVPRHFARPAWVIMIMLR